MTIASLAFSAPAGAKSHFTVIDAPGSTFTIVRSISDGTTTGYSDVSAFVRTPNGMFTEFSAPDAVFGTFPVSINKGVVTGYYVDSSAVNHGFVRARNGTITEFDAQEGGATNPASICNGVVTGSYIVGNVSHGFLRAANGRITIFDPAGSSETEPAGINSGGVITGSFDDDGTTHGFVRAKDGTITTIDPPASTYTIPTGLNKDGVISGWYSDGGMLLGFVRSMAGTYTSFNAGNSGNNDVFGIDSKGEVTGYYVLNNDGVPRGFARLSSGKIKPFNPPGSTYTVPLDIDSGADAGAIVGYYEDSSGNYHGFLRTP